MSALPASRIDCDLRRLSHMCDLGRYALFSLRASFRTLAAKWIEQRTGGLYENNTRHGKKKQRNSNTENC